MLHSMLTSNAEIDAIKPDKLVTEVVVKVRSVDRLEKKIRKSDGGQFTVFSFIVDNEEAGQEGKGRFFYCQAFDSAVDKFYPKVAAKAVIRINNAVATSVNAFTMGKTNFYLLLNTTTTIEPVGYFVNPFHEAAFGVPFRNFIPANIPSENPSTESTAGPSEKRVREPDDVDELFDELGEGMRTLDADKRKKFKVLCRRALYNLID